MNSETLKTVKTFNEFIQKFNLQLANTVVSIHLGDDIPNQDRVFYIYKMMEKQCEEFDKIQKTSKELMKSYLAD